MIKEIKTSKKIDAALDEMMKLIELNETNEINFLSIYNKKENFEQIKSRMEADEIRIIKLYGKNGIL